MAAAEQVVESTEEELEERAKAKADDEPDAAALAAIAGEDDDDKAVPYARFKQVSKAFRDEQEARLRLEGEAGALRQLAKAPAPTDKAAVKVDVRELRKLANDALLEGNADKATQLHAQADDALREEGANLGTERAMARMRQESIQERLDDAAERMAEKYPFLDSASPEADKAAIAEVVEWRDFYMSKGVSPAKALERAAAKIGEPVLKATTKAGVDDDDDAAAQRERQAIVRGALAAKRQPPPPSGGKGDRAAQSQLPDVSKMTDEEFDKLTASEKARLRGDY